jgi:hypothetical protein
MGLLEDRATRERLIDLLLRLPGASDDVQVRRQLASALPSGMRARLPSPGSAYNDIRALVELADDENLWAPGQEPLLLRLSGEAVMLAPGGTVIHAELASFHAALEAAWSKRKPPVQGPSSRTRNASSASETAGAPAPSSALLRRMLLECFNSAELQVFCYDHYRQVYLETEGSEHPPRAQALFVACERDGLLGELEVLLRKERSRCFERIENSLKP